MSKSRGTLNRAPNGPYHVVHIKSEGYHIRYDIYCGNRPFLTNRPEPNLRDEDGNLTEEAWPLKRHEAYAIVRLLNGEKRATQWNRKFGDPLTRTR
jgi:hypothetical protein